LQRQFELSEEERGRLKNVIEVLQADLRRMGEQVKQADLALQEERGRGNASLIEINSSKRNKLTEVERVRAELEVLKKAEVDQVRGALQLEI
jgi:hypothetical protein